MKRHVTLNNSNNTYPENAVNIQVDADNKILISNCKLFNNEVIAILNTGERFNLHEQVLPYELPTKGPFSFHIVIIPKNVTSNYYATFDIEIVNIF